jgi:hypothetical protein
MHREQKNRLQGRKWNSGDSAHPISNFAANHPPILSTTSSFEHFFFRALFLSTNTASGSSTLAIMAAGIFCPALYT